MNAGIAPDHGYSRIYRRWHSYSPGHIAEQKAFFSRMLKGRLPEDLQARILDFGCGMGFTLMSLEEMGYKNAEGLDRDRELVAAGRSRGLAVQLVSSALDFLRDHPDSFDAVLLLDLLEHIHPDQHDCFLAALHASLRPGGRIILTVPNANASVAWRWRYICWTHETSFTEISLTERLLNAGFQSIAVQGYELMPRPRLMLLFRPAVLRWLLLHCYRLYRRLVLMSELGSSVRRIPLTPNLLAMAFRSTA